jgi:hypothetical protein
VVSTGLPEMEIVIHFRPVFWRGPALPSVRAHGESQSHIVPCSGPRRGVRELIQSEISFYLR